MSSARAGSGPASAAATSASSMPSAAMNWGGGVPAAASTRIASHSARACAVSPSSTAIWARSRNTNALASATP